MEISVLLDGIVFGEGPRWRDGQLWFSDIFGNRVMSVDLTGKATSVAELDRPSGLGFMPDGELLVALMRERRLVRIASGGVRTHADLTGLAENGLNDMVVDADGRAYVDADQNIALVEPEGGARIVAEGLRGPNGLAITPDGGTLVVNEVSGAAIQAFPIRADGSLGEARLFADLPGTWPDGLCLDAEGAAWIGSYRGGEFLRVREGGEVTDRIATPGRWAVAPMLGGPDRRTLFLMTAVTASLEALIEGDVESCVEIARVDVAGAGWP